MNKNHEIDISGVPEQNIQESLDGLKNNEVRNLNNETQQPALNGAEGINRLVGGVTSGTSPSESIRRYKDAVKEALECRYMEFLYSQSMGGWKYWVYANPLGNELNLTDEQVHTALKEVYADFARRANPREWDIFLHGTSEQVAALQNEIAREVSEYYAAQPDSGLLGSNDDAVDGERKA